MTQKRVDCSPDNVGRKGWHSVVYDLVASEGVPCIHVPLVDGAPSTYVFRMRRR